jgi:hypothetical protein
MKQDLRFLIWDSLFGVVDWSNEGCSCSVVKEKSITSKYKERDFTMVIILWVVQQ